MFHRSQRLFLRPAFSEDWEVIHAAIGSDAELARNLARAPWPYEASDARGFVALPQDWRFPHFMVTLPGTGVIGSAGLGDHDGTPEIGYWIARAHRGHGFATEAAQAVLNVAQTLGHRRLAAGHFTDNPASGRVLRKLGFVPTGRLAQRRSRARGELVDLVEYLCDLDARGDFPPVLRAA